MLSFQIKDMEFTACSQLVAKLVQDVRFLRVQFKKLSHIHFRYVLRYLSVRQTNERIDKKKQAHEGF